jgi:hypothetical protein
MQMMCNHNGLHNMPDILFSWCDKKPDSIILNIHSTGTSHSICNTTEKDINVVRHSNEKPESSDIQTTNSIRWLQKH